MRESGNTYGTSDYVRCADGAGELSTRSAWGTYPYMLLSNRNTSEQLPDLAQVRLLSLVAKNIQSPEQSGLFLCAT